MRAIGSAYDARLTTTEVGAGPAKIRRDNLELSVEKVTPDTLRNRTEDPIRGVQLRFDLNSTDIDEEETIEIKVKTYTTGWQNVFLYFYIFVSFQDIID